MPNSCPDVRRNVPESSRFRTILFVDDDLDFLELIERVFRLWSKDSLKILTTHTVGKAIILLQQHQVDFTVTDIRMPVVDGIQFLKLLHRKHPNMLKVVLTGMAEEQCRKICLDSGASLFIEKPRDLDGMESVYTAMMELANSVRESGFSGVLKQANMGEMVQMLCLGGGSVILELNSSVGHGEIYISKGAILYAQAGGYEGYDAFYYLMSLQGGEFVVKPFVEPPHRLISGSWEALLMESARQRDELVYFQEQNGQDSANDLAHRFKTVPLPSLTQRKEISRSPEVDEVVVCDLTGEVIDSSGVTDAGMRVDLLDFITVKGRQISQTMNLPALDQLYMEGDAFTALLKFGSETKSFALSEQKRLSLVQLQEKLSFWKIKYLESSS